MLELCNIQEMKSLLGEYDFHFSKAKGQNFLTAAWVPQRIAEEAGVDETAGVLEIGPGIGPLTQQLCLRAKKVVAVEVDTTLKPILKRTLGEFDILMAYKFCTTHRMRHRASRLPSASPGEGLPGSEPKLRR